MNIDDAMNRIPSPFVSLLALLLIAVPATAMAQTNVEEMTSPDDDLVEGQDEDDRPWGVSASLRSMVGQGTFASVSNDSEWAGQVDDGSNAFDRWNLVFGITPSYEVGDFSFSANLSWVQWLTPGGGNATSSASGGANEPYQFRFQDISVDAGWRSFTWDALGITASPSMSLRLPTSKVAQMETLLADVGLGVGLQRTFFDKLTLVGELSGSKAFHEFTSPVVEIDTVGQDNVIYRPGGAEDIEPGRIAVDGRNIEYTVGGTVGASFSLPADLSATINYGLFNYWTYDVENDDEFMSEYATPGRGWSQVSLGTFGLSYQVNDWIGTSLMATTIQTPKTADNQSFRFPFWNFTGAAANSTGITFAVTGTY